MIVGKMKIDKFKVVHTIWLSSVAITLLLVIAGIIATLIADVVVGLILLFFVTLLLSIAVYPIYVDLKSEMKYGSGK